jgi:uncharacterized SAM-binding protein YcdF (DUF218 family)
MPVGNIRSHEPIVDASLRLEEPSLPETEGRRRWPLVLFGGACGIAAFLVAGFVWFAARVATDEIALRENADGIVVLTGGSARVVDAIELLAAGHGRRLLISGANPANNPGGITRLVPLYESMFACCIDLDHSMNTVGNAIGTRQWAKSRGFRSLIVVTSNYHMPRAMTELAHQLPDATLIAFPVVPALRRGQPWWASPASARLLIIEYLKYIYAVARIQLEGPPPTDVAALSGMRA